MKILKIAIVILITAFFYSCNNSSDSIERINEDVKTIQNDFEKEYKQPVDTGWISVDTIIIDSVFIKRMDSSQYKYYRIKFSKPENTHITVKYIGCDSLNITTIRP